MSDIGRRIREALKPARRSAAVILHPGAEAQQLDAYTVRIRCGGCGEYFEAGRSDDEPLRPSDIPEMLATMQCGCQVSAR